jgi:hypothetical protein
LHFPCLSSSVLAFPIVSIAFAIVSSCFITLSECYFSCCVAALPKDLVPLTACSACSNESQQMFINVQLLLS